MEKLGVKQRQKNEDWISTLKNIECYVSQSYIKELTDKTVERILETTAGKKTAYAWSGGKDSIVLGKICEMASIEDCMLARCNLEYPAFMKWIEEHKPKNLTVINTGQDLIWLSKHDRMLFPVSSSTSSMWFRIVQHNAQDKYFKENKLDMMIVGRRKADGNYVGKQNNIYTNAKGICRYSPLADWTHEEILAFIHYNNLEMPPIYSWRNGFVCGTHPWPARIKTGSVENGWFEIYEIDPQIVRDAAKYIKSAQDYLNSLSE